MRAAAFTAALACALVACASARAQSASESRYGPAPERAPTPVAGRALGYAGAPYAGRSLGWSGKREIVAPAPQAAVQVQPWWARTAPQAQQPPTARAAYSAPAPAFAPQALQPSGAPRPQSLYDAPAPALAASPAPPVKPAAPPSAPQPAFRDGQVGARTYSVGRQFGMAPDPIPAAGPPRMVLIAPPPAPDDDKPRDADGEWSAKPEKDTGQ